VKPDTTHVQYSIELLRSGGVVALPTETVYGLAADITQPAAIEKIFNIKERPFFDPLIVHVADVADVNGVVAEWPDLARKLTDKFWPGPLTLILPKKDNVNSMITSGLQTVAVRMPNHDLTREVIRRLGHPIAAPSANKFGRTSPSKADHVRQEFGDSVFVLDGGPCPVGVESTVIGFANDYKTIEVYRPGVVTVEMLSAFAETKMAENNSSPGMLEHHYMPTLPLLVLDPEKSLSLETYENICQRLGKPWLYPSWMQLPDEPQLAARHLYANMRKAATKTPANVILLNYSMKKKQQGLWAAVTDRLQKASTSFADI
jgi:L-threonylcarbamoyladenylate synthase